MLLVATAAANGRRCNWCGGSALGIYKTAEQQLQMGLAQRIGCEIAWFVPPERVAPQHCHDQRRDDAADGIVDIDGAELAALDAGFYHSPKQAHAASNDLVSVKSRQLGEVSSFRDHDLRDGADGCRDDRGPAPDQQFE